MGNKTEAYNWFVLSLVGFRQFLKRRMMDINREDILKNSF